MDRQIDGPDDDCSWYVFIKLRTQLINNYHLSTPISELVSDITMIFTKGHFYPPNKKIYLDIFDSLTESCFTSFLLKSFLYLFSYNEVVISGDVTEFQWEKRKTNLLCRKYLVSFSFASSSFPIFADIIFLSIKYRQDFQFKIDFYTLFICFHLSICS